MARTLGVGEEEKYRKLQGTYPVIFLSFADIKEETFEQAYIKICKAFKCYITDVIFC